MVWDAAFMSLSNKEDALPLAQTLSNKKIKIYASSGTYRYLTEKGIEAINIDQFTGFASLLGNRIKTLHPYVYSSILYDKKYSLDVSQMPIKPVQLVVVSLYPFEDVAMKKNVSDDELIENIDIGGVSLIRASAKNYINTIPVVSAEDYDFIADKVRKEEDLSIEERKYFAAKAFRYTSYYDSIIASELNFNVLEDFFTLPLKSAIPLRYGENPHQKAKFYTIHGHSSFGEIRQLHGSALSYNNLLDIDGAVSLVNEFDNPFAVGIKHLTPCGASESDEITKALKGMIRGDVVSIYGGIVAVNREFDDNCVKSIKGLFVDCLIAPSYTESALEKLKKRQKIKIIEYNRASDPKYMYRSTRWGMLIQEIDNRSLSIDELKVVTNTPLDKEYLGDIIFGWKIIKNVRSNGIAIVKNRMILGIGSGQTSRVMAVKIACMKAGENANGAVLISDAYFPFRDGIDVAAEHGIKVIIQPGGSIRDQEVIDSANEHGIAMAFTGWRRFSH
ncbi:MAG: bifunctional phosphoribosylaminoimidazolecarboxamide formyltransferase/IMP cyclohydrolase [Thermoplasmata archaeon]